MYKYNFSYATDKKETVVSDLDHVSIDGQIHFLWEGDDQLMTKNWSKVKKLLHEELGPIEKSMKNRGGGILEIKLLPKFEIEENLYHLFFEFDTQDSMGANFINSVLEHASQCLPKIENAIHPTAVYASLAGISFFSLRCLMDGGGETDSSKIGMAIADSETLDFF